MSYLSPLFPIGGGGGIMIIAVAVSVGAVAVLGGVSVLVWRRHRASRNAGIVASSETASSIDEGPETADMSTSMPSMQFGGSSYASGRDAALAASLPPSGMSRRSRSSGGGNVLSRRSNSMRSSGGGAPSIPVGGGGPGPRPSRAALGQSSGGGGPPVSGGGGGPGTRLSRAVLGQSSGGGAPSIPEASREAQATDAEDVNIRGN
jgi:hypothetical protein